MTTKAITNLHKTALGHTHEIKEKSNNLIKDIQVKIGEISNQISTKLPSLMGHLDVAGQLKARGLIKHKLLKKLNGKRKKFRLALESLGWGTLADLLDSAMCGEQLNIWV